MTHAVIIVAAGKGVRAAGAGDKPKQYLDLDGIPVLRRTLEAFLGHDAISLVLPVINPDHRALYNDAISGIESSGKLLEPVQGGDSRQASVLAGLQALTPHQPAGVMIHDAARPFIDADLIGRIVAALETTPACLAAIPLTDTLKSDRDGLVAATISRDGLWRAQTPQAFHFDLILGAHELASHEGKTGFTDDAAIAEWRGIEVALVSGSERNIKLTTPEDFELAQKLMRRPALRPELRVGNGFDVHAFAPGDHVMLCGVAVPHTARLSGHSDADVGLHALTDALLGAIGSGDIGSHFPPSDPQWEGTDSAVFLRHAAKLVAEAGGRIVNADVTLICERPKIGPHREAMRERIGDLLGIETERVGVKATTTEGLGFTGRGEGIAAMASASVELNRRG